MNEKAWIIQYYLVHDLIDMMINDRLDLSSLHEDQRRYKQVLCWELEIIK